MKKRLLSMLMAVLMIASLVPAAALADGTTADSEHLINIKADAAAKQPGIIVDEVKDANGVVTDYTVSIKAFAKIKDQCKVCTNLVTKELVKADCETPGLTVYYCGTCGKAMMANIDSKLVSPALGHTYSFTVVEKPTCTESGWGYAVCDVCGKAVAVMGVNEALTLLPTDAKEDTVKAVTDLFKATGHKEGVVVAQDGKDANGVAVKAAVEPTHATTIDGYAVAYKDGKIVSAKVEDSEVPSVAGYTGDKVCPDCGVVVEKGKVVDSLDVAHKDYMTTITKGAKPADKADADGDYADGATDVIYCAKCDKTYGGDVLTSAEFYCFEKTAEPKLGDTKVVGAVAATCQKVGNTGDTYTYAQVGLNADGTVKGDWVLTAKGEEIAKLAHHYVAPENVAPTCTEMGKEYKGYYVCDNVVDKTADGKDVLCGDSKHDLIWSANDKVPALGHDYTVEKVLVEATCQNTGLSVLVCSRCGAYELDTDTVKVYNTDKVNHVAADELANVVEATCTEAGYSGDQVCKWCGETLKKGEEVAALGHTTEVKDAKDATCTEAGYTGDEVCTVCGETVKKGEEIAALGHKFENGVCTVCGAADPDYVVPNPFKDVEESSPYYDAIIWAANKGVTTGKTADTFGVNDGCTRAQIVTFLYRAAGSPEVAADTVNPFTDVSKDSVYYNAIMWAVEKGITKGTTETTFDPNAVCTRGQIVTFLFRASGDEKVATGVDFTDVAADSYCADAVAWAVANGVTKGVTATTFAPDATCTRGQAVTFIYRALAE